MIRTGSDAEKWHGFEAKHLSWFRHGAIDLPFIDIAILRHREQLIFVRNEADVTNAIGRLLVTVGADVFEIVLCRRPDPHAAVTGSEGKSFRVGGVREGPNCAVV